ncbi:MAG: hypothetical protein EA394_07250 [Bacteroidia bacterium]|nr:MAG: hypothetical protein EA394_07250 [Bacteroidia bacterium]
MLYPKPIIMRRITIFVIVLLMTSSGLIAGQNNDPVLIRIEDKEITRSRFADIYRKNNLESMVAEPKEVDEYLEMYINFRLKVLEAVNQGMDTTTSFLEELRGYRDQLARQYLTDNEVTEELVREAWERGQYDLRVSHILMNLDPYAPADDTLQVYEQMLKVRQRILDGEPFSELALEMSDDPSAHGREATATQPARRGNAGDLGYFSVFHMVYDFETAAYNTPVGEVSMPFRTNFGYHIIKVADRLPAMGRARVAHIMLMTPVGMDEDDIKEKENQINDLHRRVMEGEDFGELAGIYSEDRQSATRNGEMPAFTSNRMVSQFIQAISKLENPGDISPPVRTDFGWHIIKLLEKTTPPPFEDVHADLRNRIQRDERSQLSQQAVLKRLKNQYGFTENPEKLSELYEIVDATIFNGTWDKSKAQSLTGAVATFGDQTYDIQDFVSFLDETQRRQTPAAIPSYINQQYDRFINEMLIGYKDSRLEEMYPEFREVVQEYHDGILLFEITDREVWSRATVDTLGLERFFEANRDRYQAGELSEVRGMVIADYQNYLEEEWVLNLRKKYEIWVDEDLLKTITFEDK